MYRTNVCGTEKKIREDLSTKDLLFSQKRLDRFPPSFNVVSVSLCARLRQPTRA